MSLAPKDIFMGKKGYKPSEETLRKMSIAQTGRKHSEATKLKMSLSAMGHLVSKETREKQSKLHRGKKASEETRRKMSEKRLGKKFSEEHKRNLSIANTGKKRSAETRKKLSEVKKGKTSTFLGKHHSQESKLKLRMAHQGKKCPWLAGKNNHKWNGGVTTKIHKIRTSLEYDLWREAVFIRDDFTCVKYKIKGGKLRAHHILNFAEYEDLRFDINNGITLSDKAHKEFHRKYGIKHNTREQLEEFLKN